jgi:UDP-N-acetylmuramoyl-tripeptide--D-alanyl-D-alanine ligase
MSLWTSEEIKLATDGKVIGEWVVDGISIDTRNLVKGDLFIALKDKRDGHDFVKKAFECGAVAALVSHIPSGLSGDSNIVLVPDVLQALQNMARFSRKRFQGKLIAITGSVGKTSTKEMLKTVLNYQGETHASEKSFNNHWGVPLTLARMPSKTEYAILELGMNKSGEIRQHSLLSKPHVALITTVNMVHMSSFKNLGEIALAKSEIFDGLVENGTAIVNSDIEPLEIVKKTFADCNGLLVTFGKNVADWKLNSIKTNDHSISVFATQNQNDFNFELISLGEHFALNSLAVLAVVNSLKLDLATAITELQELETTDGKGRCQHSKFER